MQIIRRNILVVIIIGGVSLFSACSKQPPVATENEPGIFSVKFFNADAELMYRPAQEDTAIKITWSLFYELQNQSGSIESFAMSFTDSLVVVAEINNTKPQIADTLFEIHYNTWTPANLMYQDSILFDLNIKGIFWNYDFQSNTIQEFGDSFGWSKTIRSKVQK